MTSVFEMNKTTISGRRFTRRQLEDVRQTVAMFPNLSRNELAKTLCEHLCWKTPRGTNKVSSCIKLLTELERQGIVTLPEKDPVKAEAGKKSSGKIEHASEENAIEGELSSLKPIVLKAVETKEEHARLKSYLQTFHYLGYRKPIGSHLSYFVKSEATGRLLGCMQFSATAKPLLAPRDEWIGWKEKQKKKLLHLVLNQNRFLIFPWVSVKNLASTALSLATQQLGDDWTERYGYRPVLVETFVDQKIFTGACYKAASWEHIGQTKGRGDDPTKKSYKSSKDIYVYPLRSDFRQSLTQGYRKNELKKRYRYDVKMSHRRCVPEDFVKMWEKVVHIFREVAEEADQKWRVRKRLIDSLLIILFVFRLVTSKNHQRLWYDYR